MKRKNLLKCSVFLLLAVITFSNLKGQSISPSVQEWNSTAAPGDEKEVFVTFEAECSASSIYSADDFKHLDRETQRRKLFYCMGQNERMLALVKDDLMSKYSGVREIRIHPMACALSMQISSEDLNSLIQDYPNVVMIELTKDHPVYLHEPVSQNASPLRSSMSAEPGILAVKADELWKMGYSGKNAKLLTFDTGVWPDHPALGDRFLGKRVPLSQAWFGFDSPFPYDKTGSHGTHVTGTAAGLDKANSDTIGIAFRSYFMATDPIVGNISEIKTMEQILTAYEWAINPDGDTSTFDDMPDVINNSWGHPFDTAWDEGLCNGWISDMFLLVEAMDIMSFQSAGNNGPGSQTVGSPASSNGSVINNFAIGAINAANVNFPIASFSSRGPSVCNDTGSLGIKPEVVAPGVNVRSAERSSSGAYIYTNKSGTSMACPHVSGVALLLREAFPQASAKDIKEALFYSAYDLGTPGEDNVYGMGMIDALASFEFLDSLFSPAVPSNSPLDLSVLNYSLEDKGFVCQAPDSITVNIYSTLPRSLNSIGITYGVFGDTTLFHGFDSGTIYDTLIVTLPLGDVLHPGWNDFFVRVENFGGMAEDDPINNTYFKSIYQIPNAALPFSEDFNQDNIHSLEFIVVNNDDNKTWDTAWTNVFGPGAFMNFSGYSPRSYQKDELITPNFDITNTDSLTLSFDLSYLFLAPQLNDSLHILASFDCGLTWNDTVYSKGQVDLNTSSKTPVANWLPTEISDWRREEIDLTRFAGYDHIMLKWVATNGKGNNLYMDNINIERTPLISSISSLTEQPRVEFFPNPVRNEFTIKNRSDEGIAVSFIDLSGKPIGEQKTLPSKSTITLNVSSLNTGIYLLRIEGDKAREFHRLIKL